MTFWRSGNRKAELPPVGTGDDMAAAYPPSGGPGRPRSASTT